LKRVNLITGENNSGKTALLEGLFLHAGAFNPALVLNVAGLRGIVGVKVEYGRPIQTPWTSLFANLDESLEIKLQGLDAARRCRVLTIRPTSDPNDLRHVRSISEHDPTNGGSTASSANKTSVLRWHHSGGGREDITLLFFDGPEVKVYPQVVHPPIFPGRFVGSRWTPDFVEIAEQFGELEVENRQKQLLDSLRIIEPRLTRLATVMTGRVPMLHADIGIERLIPIAVLGDGILRLATIVLWIIHTSGGVLFIDEIENGFHYSHLRQIWSALAICAKQFDVQLFATTHSRECVIAAHHSFSETFDYDFSLHRLERSDSGNRAVTYDRESLEGAVESGFEFR